MSTNRLDDLSCLIPLYRSKAFLGIIVQNIEEHLKIGATILISDKHCLDDTTSLLERRYHQNKNVIIYKSNDNGDWVDNINFLIGKTNTKYARIIPHDDSASSNSSLTLVRSLLINADAIIASGVVKAFDIENNPIPDKDELNKNEMESNKSWGFEDVMSFFWTGRFSGAFKGVFNVEVVQSKNIYIKKTPTLAQSERLWLSALAMIGRYQFERTSVLKKRYYKTSTHAKWTIVPKNLIDSGKVLCEYAEQLISDKVLMHKSRFIIHHNAIQKARYKENKIGQPPIFTMLTFDESVIVQQLNKPSLFYKALVKLKNLF